MNDKKKHHVFSARTTEEGLKVLNGIRESQGMSWDELIIAAINGHYGVEVPRIELTGPTPEERAKAKAEKEAAKEAKAKEREDAKRAKADEKAKRQKTAADKKAKKEAEAKAKAEKAAKDAKETAPEPVPESEPEPETTEES